MKIYVAGPMRGYPGLNFRAFEEATVSLRRFGHEVRSPAEHDGEVGIGPDDEQRPDYSVLIQRCFRWDIEAILWADAVALLTGWEKSVGAGLETKVAAAIGTPCLSINSPIWEENRAA